MQGKESLEWPGAGCAAHLRKAGPQPLAPARQVLLAVPLGGCGGRRAPGSLFLHATCTCENSCQAE